MIKIDAKDKRVMMDLGDKIYNAIDETPEANSFDILFAFTHVVSFYLCSVSKSKENALRGADLFAQRVADIIDAADKSGAVDWSDCYDGDEPVGHA